MYTLALGWIKDPVLSIKETQLLYHCIFSGGGSSNIPENYCMSTSVSSFFVAPYFGHFPVNYFHHAIHLAPWLLSCCTFISPFGNVFFPLPP